MFAVFALSLQALATPLAPVGLPGGATPPAPVVIAGDTLDTAGASRPVPGEPALVLPAPAEPLVARPLPTLPALVTEDGAPGPVAGTTRIGADVPHPTTTLRITAPPAVEFSDWYYRRLAWHRALSWAMVPLFIGSYVSGEQLLDKGDDAPTWARRLHPAFAGGSAFVFGANQVTGWWNLVEGWKVKEGRTTRLLHTIAMTVASAGFVYAGSIGEEARDNRDTRDRHRTVALGSMGVSTASWLFMLFKN